MRIFLFSALLFVFGCSSEIDVLQQRLYKNLKKSVKLCYMLSVTTSENQQACSNQFEECIDKAFDILNNLGDK